MPAAPHHCRVYGSPWPGLHVTDTVSGRHFGRHWHATFGVGLLEDGAQRSASGRGAVEAFAGDLITTNPGEVHDGRPLGGPARRWRIAYVEPELFTSVAGDALAPGLELARPVLRDPAVKQALLQLLDRVQAWNAPGGRPCGASALACEEALVHTLGLLLARHASTPCAVNAAEAKLSPVRDLLADDLLQPPTLTALATVAGISKFQLLRRFKQAYGVTPYAWLQQQRTERARTLVARGTPLAAAAAAAGFADQSHMTRSFARQFGFTPGALRRAALQ